MAATQNYSLPLPQLGEPADIRVLDQGTEMIDGIMHGNRTMVAPGWVSTETYNTGSRVVYLGEYYKCKADNVTGAWDATKWDKTTVGEDIEGLGTGGASALADLDDVEITSPTDGQALLFDDDDDKWKNGTLPDPSVVKEVMGNPIELTDAAAAPLVKCVTQITGSQDLHGYDKPWVGGAGKNKLNPSAPVETFDLTGEGVYRYGLSFEGNKTYTIVNTTSSQEFYYRTPKADLSDRGTSVKILANSSATVTVPSDCILWIFTGTLSAWITYVNDYAVNIGNDTEYSPYSNICPITAYTEGEIEVSDGYGNVTTHTTTYPSAIYRGSEDVVNGEVGADDEEMWVTVDISTLNFSPSTGSRHIFRSDSLRGIIKPPETPSSMPYAITSCYCGMGHGPISENDNGYFAVAHATHGYEGRLVIIDHRFSTIDDFVAGIAGQTIAYRLNTPTTSSVTPTNLPIRTLSGYNHIESSTGSLTLEYIRNTYQPLVDLIQSGNGHTYSTQEQVVGKWIDGSDLYEITIETTSPSTINTDATIEDLTDLNYGQIVSIDGILYAQNLSQYIPIFWSYGTSLMGSVYVEGNNLKQELTNANYLNCPVWVTLRYTKSTQTRSLNAPTTSQKAQIEPLDEKEEEVPTEEEKAVETPETEEETDER